MAGNICEKLREEIADTQKRRLKLNILKIGFITALLGFGSVRLKEFITFYPVLYLVPLVAVFFDLLIMGEHFSIRRIGCFLRLRSEDKLEQDYELHVAQNRDRFFKFGSWGFTLLSILVACALLANTKGIMSIYEILWFLVIFCFFCIVMYFGNKRLKKLDQLIETPTRSK